MMTQFTLPEQFLGLSSPSQECPLGLITTSRWSLELVLLPSTWSVRMVGLRKGLEEETRYGAQESWLPCRSHIRNCLLKTRLLRLLATARGSLST